MSDDQILEVVQAHKEGKKIQGKAPHGSNVWVDLGNEVDWNFQSREYRVSPEPPTEELCPCCGKPRKSEPDHKLPPREWWIVSDASNGPWRAYTYRPSFLNPEFEKCYVHVREVIE